MKRPCLDCGALTENRSRCRRCQAKAVRGTPKVRASSAYYDRAWRDHSRRLREAWVEGNGWVCPGWKRPAHASTDLVVDHDVGVLCRGCNGVKAATFDKQRRRG